LRHAGHRRPKLAVFHHTRFEPLPDQLQHPPIRDASSDQLHQLVVIDAAEVIADVGVERVMMLVAELAQGFECHQLTPLGPVAVRARKKVRLEDRFQHELRRHLDYAVSHRRDAQWPLLSVCLWNVPAQGRARPVLTCTQHHGDRFQEACDAVLFHLRDRLGIEPSRAAVLFHPLPCLVEDVTPPQAIVQRMESALR
jgi:hypothetical protein